MVLMPSTITQAGTSADVQVTPGMVVFGGAGGRNNEGRLLVDGLNTGASLNGARRVGLQRGPDATRQKS